MRVGIDCRKILNPEAGEQAGIAHYTYYLVKNLLKLDKKNEYVLFFDDRILDTSEFQKPNVQIKFFPFRQYKRYLPFAYSHMLIAGVLNREKLDLFHSPTTAIPLTYGGKSIVTLHDLAIFHHPEWFPGKFLPGQTFSTKVLVPKSLKAAGKIIAVSEHTKKDAIKLFNIPAEKIKVIYEGVVPAGKISRTKISETIKHFKLDGKYILFLGTIEPRKNIIGIIRAYKNLVLRDRILPTDCQLVIAGGRGWKNKEIFQEIKKANWAIKKKFKNPALKKNSWEFVKYLGCVTHEQKIALMKEALCFIWPSFYEGFGLPILEAMSLGTPVITSEISSIPEVTAQAAVLVNPYKVDDIACALERVLTDADLRKSLSQKGLIRAKKFTWEKTARETIGVYKSLE